MSLWYRASQSSNIKLVFSGEGGLYTAGRWNHLGRKVIYCSDSISLCTLEWLSHHGLSVSGFNYYRYVIDIPDDLIHYCLPAHLPDKWNTTPAIDISRDFADKHLFSSNSFLALALPSVLVPEEYNLVINPLHQDFIGVMRKVKQLGQHKAPVRI